MQISDFKIGVKFSNSAQDFLCTDVGTRTVAAIPLTGHDAAWLQGPPYLVKEVLFTEADLEPLFLSVAHAISQVVSDTRGITYSVDASKKIMKGRFSEDTRAYPYPGLLKIDRFIDGEIYSPYAARRCGDGWLVKVIIPYKEEFVEVGDVVLRDAPVAKDEDYMACRIRHEK